MDAPANKKDTPKSEGPPKLTPEELAARPGASSHKFVGPHVSASGGVENAVLNAYTIGARAFGLYTRNQRQWFPKPLEEKSILLFHQYLVDYGYSPRHILPHASYLINLGNPNAAMREKSSNAFLDELQRCEVLGLEMLNFHPGSFLNEISPEECLKYIAEEMNALIAKTNSVKLVLENTAGQGTNLGFRFEQLAYIIERIDKKGRVGVCIDTAHTLAAGYEIRTPEAYSSMWEEFDSIIGGEYLSGLHLNDSKKDLGSRVDRHASVGEGVMGNELFKLVMNDPRLDNLPIILETPNEAIWADEIKQLYALI